MELYHIIRKVIDNRGQSCITERTFLHCLDDEQVFHNVNTHAYRHVLQLMITNGYTQRLLQIGHWNTESKTLATSFAQQEAIRTEVATYLFHCLAYGLRWSQTAPTLQVPSVPAPTPSKTKASGKKTPTQPDKRVAELEQKLKETERKYDELLNGVVAIRSKYAKALESSNKEKKNTKKEESVWDILVDGFKQWLGY